MNPLLEMRPGACLFVVGPQLTRNSSSSLCYISIISCGLEYLKELGVEQGRGDIEALIKTDPLAAMQKTVSLIRANGNYEEWRMKTFGARNSSAEKFSSVAPDSVQWLLTLHEMGAMLACTQYDMLLDNMAGLKPATVSSKDPAFAEWLACNDERQNERLSEEERLTDSERPQIKVNMEQTTSESCPSQGCGFLHLHGVQTAPDSIRLFPYSEKQEAEGGGESSADTDSRSFITSGCLDKLRELFHNKLIFLVGFEAGYEDPLLSSFLQLMHPEGDTKVLKNLPILLTSSENSSFLHSDPPKILQLRIPSTDSLREVIVPGSPKNFSVGKLKSMHKFNCLAR